MQIEFAEPDARLSSFISLYYRIRSDEHEFSEIDRADIGHVRFLLKGHGHMAFHDGTIGYSTPVMLTGPGNAAAQIRLKGPVDAVGCSILPLSWGGTLLPCDAKDHADKLCDAEPLLGDHFTGICAKLKEAGELQEMKHVLDAHFSSRIGPLKESSVNGVEQIRAWLSSSDDPKLYDLTGGVASVERRLSRIANRFFGGPPKALARKIRALKAAQAIMQNDGEICDAAIDPFYDQSHMVREIKHFTGRSPGRLVSPDEMLLQLLLDRPYFRELEPDDTQKSMPPPRIGNS